MHKILRRWRKFSGNLECSNTGIDSRQGAKYAKFGIERLIILQTILFIFSDLCGLGVFAGDIPSFGCGFAALGSLRPIPLLPKSLSAPLLATDGLDPSGAR